MSNSPDISLAKNRIALAYQALKNGEPEEAKRLALMANRISPDLEDPYLILAVVSAPEESLQYLRRALQINPVSVRARKGMHWAVQRLREKPEQIVVAPASRSPAGETQIAPVFSQLPTNMVENGHTRPVQVSKSKPIRIGKSTNFAYIIQWIVAVLILCVGVLAIAAFAISWKVSASNAPIPRPVDALVKPSLTSSLTNTATFTATFTPTPTPPPTKTSTPTNTPTRTATRTPKPTRTPHATHTPEATEEPISLPHENNNNNYTPPEISAAGHWIDIDLSNQMAYAYDGDSLVRSFVVSTGTWLHPTVTGRFHIYIKYRYADMRGPDYFLPDVPYVMYFYEGYGLHGTYWHNNFGTPMSHGCVNFSIPDAGWVYNFASVGTLVNIHY